MKVVDTGSVSSAERKHGYARQYERPGASANGRPKKFVQGTCHMNVESMTLAIPDDMQEIGVQPPRDSIIMTYLRLISRFVNNTCSGLVNRITAGGIAALASVVAVAIMSVTANVLLYRELRQTQRAIKAAKGWDPFGKTGDKLIVTSPYPCTPLHDMLDILPEQIQHDGGLSDNPSTDHTARFLSHFELQHTSGSPPVESTSTLPVCC